MAPRYAPSFGTFHHAFRLTGARAFMPPQGLLVVAASLPRDWDVRFVDENVRPVTDDELAWADAVLLSGMHVQRPHLDELNRRAHAAGTLTVLGGPSVSACPEWYPEVDLLHVGELGDATEALVRRLASDVTRPARQERFETTDRLPLSEFPVPAYDRSELDAYFLGTLQYSSGCPYRCEFCDIPALYGRRPRLKTPDRVVEELEAMLAVGCPETIYFVDDNFIGDPRAAGELLERLVAWQRDRGYPVRFACEATLNLAKRPELLALLREAGFTTVFCGIETPEPEALRSMRKTQNLRSPILEAVAAFNRHGLEVVSGIIVGLDTDTEATYDRISAFVEASRIPVLTMNVLYALPRTPLWDRLEAAGRLIEAPGARASNVEFLLPYETVMDGWRRCVERAYDPAAIYDRFRHQLTHTYPNRLPVGRRVDARVLRRGLGVLARVVWHVGVRADYRRVFWRFAAEAIRQRRLEGLVQAAVVAHHLITFAREHRGEAAFYRASARERAVEPVASP